MLFLIFSSKRVPDYHPGTGAMSVEKFPVQQQRFRAEKDGNQNIYCDFFIVFFVANERGDTPTKSCADCWQFGDKKLFGGFNIYIKANCRYLYLQEQFFGQLRRSVSSVLYCASTDGGCFRKFNWVSMRFKRIHLYWNTICRREPN